MDARQRRFFKVGLVGAVAALLVASIAWACTPEADIGLSPAAVASGGAPVTVRGDHFVDGAAVQIRWNAVDGPVLATTTARGSESATFSVPVTTPAVPDDAYTIVAVAQDQNGNPVVSRAQLLVGRAGAGSTAGSSQSRGGGALEVSGGHRGGRTHATTSGAAPASTHAHANPPAAAVHATPVTAATPAPAATPVASATPAARAAATTNGPRPAPRDAAKTPSPQSATGDLWSGFSSHEAPHAAGGGAAAAEVAQDSGSDPRTAIGAALLGLGLVALVGAFALAAVRRRRVPAGRP